MEHSQIEQSIRLRTLIKALNLNQSTFAKSLGMTQPNINRMVNRDGKISVEVLHRIAETYTQVNLHWLLTGNGDMYLGEKNLQENGPPTVHGKGRLEEMEERLARVEEQLSELWDRIQKQEN